MTAEDRVKAVVEFGFTERQARFLVTVMLHAGVCLLRQYTAFAGIVHGQKTRKFFGKLVSRNFATAYPCRHNRGRVYHLHHKPLYRAIGQTDSRHRRPLSAARVVEGLTLLDAVLASPDVVWLSTEEEKQVHLSGVANIAADKVPHLSVCEGASRTIRVFPDKVPIGIDLSGRWVFVYVVADDQLDRFRAFLLRHADLLRTLPAWTLRVGLPRELAAIVPACQNIVRDEFAHTIDPRLVEMLRSYFMQRRACSIGAAIENEEDYYQARRAFGASWFQVLYRHWRTEGDAALEGVSSRAIADAIERGTGRVEYYVLPHQYRHLSILVGSAHRTPTGAEQGEDTPARPRPPFVSSTPLANAIPEAVSDAAV